MVEIEGRFNRIAAAFDLTAARARTLCDSSSGSDHSPMETTDLLDLVESFIDREVTVLSENVPEEEDDDESDEDYEDVKERLREILENHGGKERRRIMDEAVNASSFVGDKRHLMAYLRNKGFDAGLCKSRWEKFGKNTAGKYEYVDVKGGGDRDRFIVETNFVGEFEIARPTRRYLSTLAQLPHVFVGTPEELKQIVRIMCFEIRRSMKQAEIYVPPWRRNGYMQAKWFGHYKRTSNEVVTRIKNCDCGPRVRFEETVKTTAFKSLKDDERKTNGLKVGQLTEAFNGSGMGLY